MDEARREEPLTGEILGPNRPAFTISAAQPYVRRRSFARLLVAVNVVVYLLMVVRGVSPFSPSVAALQHWGALDANLFFAGQRWRLVTSAFVHIGLLHLALNMWCLWYLAELAETLFGSWTTVAIYVLTGMTGNALTMGLDKWHALHSTVASIPVSAGASGAIFGLAGAVVTSLRVGRHRMPADVRRVISNSALRFALLNLVFGLLPGINNVAHFGGLVGGLVLGAGYAGCDSMLTQRDLSLARAVVSLVFLLILSGLIFWFFPVHKGRWI